MLSGPRWVFMALRRDGVPLMDEILSMVFAAKSSSW